MKIALIIPTCNAADCWHDLCEGIFRQSLAPDRVIVIDSASTDGTAERAQSAGFTLIQINREEFDHGGTRQIAVQYAANADILIYLTQDAIPLGTEAFCNLVAPFSDAAVAAAYGRQVSRPGASAIEAHARLFNYPPHSTMRSWECRNTLGFKSIFFSNAFGAYRREALIGVGGFMRNIIFGEDTVAVARLHCAGWKTAYAAEALVQHSHDYSVIAEFKRYFDIGVLHQRERWLMQQFGAAQDEGRRFVRSELRYLWNQRKLQVPLAMIRTLAKYLGYQVGRREQKIPHSVKHLLSLNRGYWAAPDKKQRPPLEVAEHTANAQSEITKRRAS